MNGDDMMRGMGKIRDYLIEEAEYGKIKRRGWRMYLVSAAAFVLIAGAVIVGSISYRNDQSDIEEKQGVAVLPSENEYSTQPSDVFECSIKSPDEYEEKLPWNMLTEDICEELGVDFEVINKYIHLLKNMADGDVVEIGNREYEQLKKTGVLSSLGIVYIDQDEVFENDMKLDLTVYLREGISHSMLMPKEDIPGKVSVSNFKAIIEEEIEKSLAAYEYSGITNGMCVGTVLTYIPYDSESEYHCGEYVRHNIYRIPDLSKIEDYYGIHTIHNVIPLYEADGYTEYYLSRISAMYEDEFFFLGMPELVGVEINDNNREMNISQMLWAAPLSSRLDVVNGTKMTAGSEWGHPVFTYWIIFENGKGLYSPESKDGSFHFETTAEFAIPDGRTFTFLNEHYMRNIADKKDSEEVLYSSQEIVVPRELALHITDLRVINQTESSYTVEVTFTKEEEIRSRAVQMATWTEAGGQDDLIWHVAVKDGNQAVCTINKSEHNNESGKYITHVYIRNGVDGNEIMQSIEIDMK